MLGTPPGDELSPGDMAGEYVIQRALARGGFGTVYIADNPLLRRRAAVKVLHREMAASREMVERFVREAQTVNLIRHPNIIDIHEFGVLPDGRPYFAMELIEGADLDALVRTKGRLTESEAIAILSPVCAALSAAHAQGIIHRDLKAKNVAIEDRGGRRIVKLLDFGIAKLMHPEPGTPQLSSAGRRLGTPHSMAPEQIKGAADARTDIYALGVLFYYLLTGGYPFDADEPLEIERLHLFAAPPRPSAIAPVSSTVDAIILRCLEKQPERRYRSVDELREALGSAMGPQAGLDAGPEAGPRSEGATAAGPVSAAAAAGIYIEAHIEGTEDDELDEALLDDLGALLATAAEVLREAGLRIPLETGSAVLGVMLLSEDGEAARLDRARAVDLAIHLRRDLTRAEGPAGRVRCAVFVHCDKVVLRGGARGVEVVSGPLLRIGAWTSGPANDRVAVSARAVEGLPVPDEARVVDTR